MRPITWSISSWSLETYSLYNFYGAMVTIKGHLYMSISTEERSADIYNSKNHFSAILGPWI